MRGRMLVSLFSPEPLAVDHVPPTIKRCWENVNAYFNVDSLLEGSIWIFICGALLVVPDGPVSAIMAASQHRQRY